MSDELACQREVMRSADDSAAYLSVPCTCGKCRGESVNFTNAATQLAREIFMARNVAFGMDEAWQTLDSRQKDIFVRQAASVIKAHAPIRSKVIATITPEAPYGEGTGR